MSTSKQDRAFAGEMSVHIEVSELALQTAIEFIGNELDPEEVFSDAKLTKWAQNQEVDSIFPEHELQEWATKNGYTKE